MEETIGIPQKESAEETSLVSVDRNLQRVKEELSHARESIEHISQFFTFEHLPPFLQDVSRPFSDLANHILQLPRNPERTVALRKLLEAKDAAVRAALAK